MNFRKSSEGGGGIIFNPKVYIADFFLDTLVMNFGKKLQYDFPKMRGEGVKGRLELRQLINFGVVMHLLHSLITLLKRYKDGGRC